MRPAMHLMRMGTMLLASALATSPGRADVLEIGAGGAQWVTGGANQGRDGARTDSTSAPITSDTPAFSPLFHPVMTSPYGLRTHPQLGYARMHEGIDLAAAMGTPIYATASGQVTFAGNSGGYGVLIQIDHGGSLQTRYGHLSRLGVRVGQDVRSGQVIGWSGSSGQSTGPHLHYEVRRSGHAVDPLPYMR